MSAADRNNFTSRELQNKITTKKNCVVQSKNELVTRVRTHRDNGGGHFHNSQKIKLIEGFLHKSLSTPCKVKVNNDNNNNRIQQRKSRLFTISSLRREPSPTHMLKWPRCNRVLITYNTSSAYHVQHVVLHATWYKGTAQLLSLTELKLHLFELDFTG